MTLAPDEIPDGQPDLRQLLGHDDRVAVGRLDHPLQLVQLHDRRDELVGDALDPVLPHLVARADRRRFRRLERDAP